MTNETTPSALTDQQIIERLAEFMGWTKLYTDRGFDWKGEYKIMADGNDWNPLQDWNHWRQVEEKMMEDVGDNDTYYREYLKYFECPNADDCIVLYMKADLPTRCKALVSVLQDSQSI